MDELLPHLTWLRDTVLREIQSGTERAAIQASNLFPPGLEQNGSAVHLAYLVLRSNLIDRLSQQHSGYWQNGDHGMDALTNADHGELLADYFALTEQQIASAVESLGDGKHEMAAELLRWTEGKFPASKRLAADRRLVYEKLMEKYQETDPFRFVVYSGAIGASTPQLQTPTAGALGLERR